VRENTRGKLTNGFGLLLISSDTSTSFSNQSKSSLRKQTAFRGKKERKKKMPFAGGLLVASAKSRLKVVQAISKNVVKQNKSRHELLSTLH